MALSKISRALSVPEGEAGKILPKEVVAWARETKKTAGGKKAKGK